MTVALPLAQTLLQCLQDSLTVNPPAQICLRAGEAVTPQLSTTEDECCSGLAWVRIASTEPLILRGQEDLTSGCFNHMRITRLEMGVVRCMPTPDADTLVTCDQWTALAAQMEADHTAMEAALCCLREEIRSGDTPVITDVVVYVEEYEPRGPDGRCLGATLMIRAEHGCSCGSGG